MQRLLSSGSSTRMLFSGLVSAPKVPQILQRHASDNSSKEGVVNETPSGWVPPSETPNPNLPFVVKRSRMNNLPVYVRRKSGKQQTLTYIKKIDGDVEEFERRLREHLNDKKLLSRVDEMAGMVILHGKYAEEVKIWLLSMGF